MLVPFSTESNPQTNYGPNAFFAGLSSQGLANGSSWDNQWDYTSVVWDSIGSNDTLYLDGGPDSLIYNSTLNVKSNGTYGNYSVISVGKDAGHNGKVIFETDTNFAAKMDGATFTELNGFSYRNITNGKIIRVQYTNHIRIKNCTLYNIQDYSGIFNLNTDNFEVIGCYFESAENINNQTDCIAIGGADSIKIIGNTVIQQNEAYDPHTDGIQLWDCEDAWIEGNKVYLVNNKSTHCQIIYSFAHSGKFWMVNNQVYISSPSNAPLVALQNASPGIDSIYICNNTIVSSSVAYKAPYVLTDTTGNYGYLVSKNNIFVNTGSSGGIGSYNGLIDYEIDYNLYYGPFTSNVMRIDGSGETLAEMQALGYDIYSYDDQPVFNNFDWTFSQDKSVFLNYDFSLSDGTLGIDLGQNIGYYNTDIEGISRPQGGAWDIGAYEITADKDLTPPEVTGADLRDYTTLYISFSEPLDSTSAQNPNNYSITGGVSTISASLSGMQVILTTSTHLPADYTVSVSNVKDLSGNLISSAKNNGEYNIVTPKLTLNAPGADNQHDMSIWVHPTDESQSTIITSDKNDNILFVYDLNGDVIQTIPLLGKPGNIDVRYNFMLAGMAVDIVGYNDRSNGLIAIYKVDPSNGNLSHVSSFDAGEWPVEIYGFSLYRSPNDKYYAFASGKSGQIRQWELVDTGDGTVSGIEKRTWINSTGNRIEGLAVDDEIGILYASNEYTGVYKYDAEPIEMNPAGQLIIPKDYNGLTQNVEGITIYYASDGEGYLLVSSQGSNNFKVYEREEPHNFVKTLIVDGAIGSEGIDVINMNLGASFPEGIFLCHDGNASVLVCDYADLNLLIDVGFWNPRNGPLPVELTFFTGTVNGNTVILKWKTETEVNNYGFEIERTKDKSKWATIGFIEGHGNSNSPKQYSFADSVANLSGDHFYRLKQIDNDGSFEYSDIVSVELGTPDEYYLSQNYPNPFNPTTKIRYKLPKPGFVMLILFDVLGSEVATLVNEKKSPGNYEVELVATALPSGVYFYRLLVYPVNGGAGDFIETKKMILLR